MTIYHYPELGLYLYASTEAILLNALENLGMKLSEPEVIKPKYGEILRIDSTGRQSRAEFAMKDTFSAWTDPWEMEYTRQWSYPSRGNFRQQYIQDLKSIAGYYGYAPEDIDNLLADGFTVEDVEEMIYCY